MPVGSGNYEPCATAANVKRLKVTQGHQNNQPTEQQSLMGFKEGPFEILAAPFRNNPAPSRPTGADLCVSVCSCSRQPFFGL